MFRLLRYYKKKAKNKIKLKNCNNEDGSATELIKMESTKCLR